MSALAKLINYNRDFARRCVAACWGRSAFHVEVEKHLINDAVTEDYALRRNVRDTTHKAETYDLEGLAAMDEAAHPDSDGGASITPKEQKKIRPYFVKSATLDHDASELTKA